MQHHSCPRPVQTPGDSRTYAPGSAGDKHDRSGNGFDHDNGIRVDARVGFYLHPPPRSSVLVFQNMVDEAGGGNKTEGSGHGHRGAVPRAVEPLGRCTVGFAGGAGLGPDDLFVGIDAR